MIAQRTSGTSFLNGVPELLILRLLAEEAMYGYEIVQAIRTRTGAVVAVGEGVVYPVLHALEAEGAIRSRRKEVEGRSRIYYSLTAAGKRRLVRLSADWTGLANAIRGVLIGDKHAEFFS
ncbi:MAG: PadR family transcriptional regulator [Terracidiphilus sp.]